MIYLFHGTDFKKSRKQIGRFLDELTLKKPDASFVQIDEESFSGARCEEFIATRGLFESQVIVVFSHVLRSKEAEQFIKDNIDALSQSYNIFVFFEEELNKNTLSLFKKHAKKVWEFNLLGLRRKKTFNIFSLSDAVGRRDRKKAWILLQQSYISGITAENIHGILLWFIKNMLLVKGKEAKGRQALVELGLNPFVLKKAQTFSRNYTYEELKKFSRDLVDIYHRARRGIIELEIGIEKLVLKI